MNKSTRKKQTWHSLLDDSKPSSRISTIVAMHRSSVALFGERRKTMKVSPTFNSVNGVNVGGNCDDRERSFLIFFCILE